MLIHVKSLQILLFPQNKKARELLKDQLPPGLLSLRDTAKTVSFLSDQTNKLLRNPRKHFPYITKYIIHIYEIYANRLHIL
jgi:hypothetical protein